MALLEQQVAMEFAKLLLMGFFSAMKTAGKTVEEIDEIYSNVKSEFDKRDPNDLANV